jgi:hypothetical protein
MGKGITQHRDPVPVDVNMMATQRSRRWSKVMRQEQPREIHKKFPIKSEQSSLCKLRDVRFGAWAQIVSPCLVTDQQKFRRLRLRRSTWSCIILIIIDIDNFKVQIGHDRLISEFRSQNEEGVAQ